MSSRRVERASSLVLRWCDLYTRGLPLAVASQRRAELESDLHDHRTAAASASRSSVARDVLVRALLGAPADLSWRTHQARACRSSPSPEVTMTARAPLDGWTWSAYLVGGVVLAWSAIIGIGMLLDARNAAAGSEDFTWRIWLGSAGLIMLALCIHAMLGLRTHPVRAAVELSIAALVTTLWMLWAAPIVAAGIAAVVFLAVYAVRTHRTAPNLEPAT